MLNRQLLLGYNPMMRNLQKRSFHTIVKPTASTIADEKPVLVYGSRDYERK